MTYLRQLEQQYAHKKLDAQQLHLGIEHLARSISPLKALMESAPAPVAAAAAAAAAAVATLTSKTGGAGLRRGAASSAFAMREDDFGGQLAYETTIPTLAMREIARLAEELVYEAASAATNDYSSATSSPPPEPEPSPQEQAEEYYAQVHALQRSPLQEDTAESIAILLQRAAELGHAAAQYELGVDMAASDEAQGVAWIAKAAEQGHSLRCTLCPATVHRMAGHRAQPAPRTGLSYEGSRGRHC